MKVIATQNVFLNIKLTQITTTLWIQEFTIEGLAGNDYT